MDGDKFKVMFRIRRIPFFLRLSVAGSIKIYPSIHRFDTNEGHLTSTIQFQKLLNI